MAISSAKRLDWLDWFRGLAVLWMIQTHTLNTFLDPRYLASGWYPWLNFANGLVAPSFLFIAGLVQGLASLRNAGNPRPLGPRLQRLGVILLTGYALQFPWNALFGWAPDLGAQIFAAFCRVDVLHCLAVSLALLLILERWVRKLDMACLILVLAAVLLTPTIWTWKSPTPSLYPLTSYLNRESGALFPLFPWLGFVGAGLICGRHLTQTRRLGMAAVGCWLAAWLWQLIAGSWLASLDYAARPDFFLNRLGWVLLFTVLCQRLSRPEKWPILLFAGRYSLTLYVLHLQIIHASIGPLPSLQNWIGKTLSPLYTGLLFVGIGALSLGFTWLINFCRNAFSKRSEPTRQAT